VARKLAPSLSEAEAKILTLCNARARHQ